MSERRWVAIALILLFLAALILCGWIWQNNIHLPIF